MCCDWSVTPTEGSQRGKMQFHWSARAAWSHTETQQPLFWSDSNSQRAQGLCSLKPQETQHTKHTRLSASIFLVWPTRGAWPTLDCHSFTILVVIRATPQLPPHKLPWCCPEPLDFQAVALWFIISTPLQQIIIQYKLLVQQLKCF